ncbi:MAG: hypothetical protein ABSD75_19705 [Terriglobales bacterium]
MAPANKTVIRILAADRPDVSRATIVGHAVPGRIRCQFVIFAMEAKQKSLSSGKLAGGEDERL